MRDEDGENGMVRVHDKREEPRARRIIAAKAYRHVGNQRHDREDEEVARVRSRTAEAAMRLQPPPNCRQAWLGGAARSLEEVGSGSVA